MTTTLEQLRAGQLAGARHLKLACGLTEFPREIFDLADTLETLDLSGNALSTLPDDLPRLHRLRILFASDNRFTELPDVLGACPQLSMIGFKANRIRTVSARSLPPQLRWLILTDNAIDTLPAELGHCSQLQKLMLAGNRLHALPETMAACSRLELVRLSSNRLNALPAWLLRLPDWRGSRTPATRSARHGKQPRRPTRRSPRFNGHRLCSNSRSAKARRASFIGRGG